MSTMQQVSRVNFPPKGPAGKKMNKYRSPDPSPVDLKNKLRVGRNIENLKENLNLVTKISKKSSTSPISKPLNKNSGAKDNVVELEEYIYKFHPALAQKNVESSKQETERLQMKIKSQSELLKQKEQEIQNKAQLASKDLSISIQKLQSDIDLLTLQLEHVKSHSKVSEKSEILKIMKENDQLEKKIVEHKVDVASIKEKGIKQEDFFLLQEKIVTLELAQNKLFDKNSLLKQELKKQQAANLMSKSLSEQKSNLQNIWNIFSLVLKLQKLSKKYIAQENINLADLISVEDCPGDASVASVIGMTRKEICNLRVLVSDIYAENCGCACQNQ